MEMLKTRKQYLRQEYEAGRVYSTRKAMVGICPLCGGWIDRTCMGSLLTEDLFEPLCSLSSSALKELWVTAPYCTACMF